MSIDNRTPFEAQALPHVNEQGMNCRLLVMKGVWSLHNNQLSTRPVPALQIQRMPVMQKIGALMLHPQQKRVMQALDWLDRSIEWWPADSAPRKQGCELIICGYGHHTESTEQFECAVRWQDQTLSLEASGPRVWRNTMLQGAGAVQGPLLEAVRHVPLHPVFTWGGIDPQIIASNPQGMGQPHHQLKGLSDGAPMPWLQLKRIKSPTALLPPKPMAFGPWDSSAAQRQRYAGTYGAEWQQTRAPQPPEDQQAAFYNQAALPLQWKQPPAPGQFVQLHGMSRHGSRQLCWPSVKLHLTHANATQTLQADTCLVSTEDDAYAPVWRAIVPAHGPVQLHAS